MRYGHSAYDAASAWSRGHRTCPFGAPHSNGRGYTVRGAWLSREVGAGARIHCCEGETSEFANGAPLDPRSSGNERFTRNCMWATCELAQRNGVERKRPSIEMCVGALAPTSQLRRARVAVRVAKAPG